MNNYRVVLLLFLIAAALSISFGAKNKANLAKKQSEKPEVKSQPASQGDKKVEDDSNEDKDDKKNTHKGKAAQQEASSKESAISESKSSEDDSDQKHKSTKTKATPASKSSLSSISKKPPSKTEASRTKILHASVSTQQDSKAKTVISQSNLQAEPQPPTFWSAFAVYMLIFSALCFGLKYVYFPEQPLFFVLVDFLMLSISLFKSKKVGYNAPQYTQEIDDYNSITVGYSEQQGRQLFWQKNSVQGI